MILGSWLRHSDGSLSVLDNHNTMSINHSFWRERRPDTDSNRHPSAYQPRTSPPGRTSWHTEYSGASPLAIKLNLHCLCLHLYSVVHCRSDITPIVSDYNCILEFICRLKGIPVECDYDRVLCPLDGTPTSCIPRVHCKTRNLHGIWLPICSKL